MHNEPRCPRGCRKRHRRKTDRKPESRGEKKNHKAPIKETLKRPDIRTNWGRKKAVKTVKRMVMEELYHTIPISEAPNCVYPKKQIFTPMIEAIGTRSYITPYCTMARARGRRIPDGDTIFYRLNLNEFNGVDGIIEWTNDILHRIAELGVPYGLFEGLIKIAGDGTDEGVFGRPDPSAVGTKKVKGASTAHRLLIAQAVTKGQNRLPLEISRSGPLKTTNQVNAHVLDRLCQSNPAFWFLADREFFAIDTIGPLLTNHLPWVIPAPRYETVKDLIPIAMSKAEPVIIGRTERVYIEPEFQLGKGERAVRFPLVFIYRPDDLKKSRRLFIFGTHDPVTPEEALLRADHYAARWGIETGNRDQDQLQGRTRSPCPMVQWFMQVFGVILYALWWMCNVFLSKGPPPERYSLSIALFQDIIQRCGRWSFPAS